MSSVKEESLKAPSGHPPVGRADLITHLHGRVGFDLRSYYGFTVYVKK